mgnify:CR=1 FL=1
MFFKNGTIFHTPGIKKDSNERSKTVFKNGTVFSDLGLGKVPAVVVPTITAYGQKILSISASSVNKFIGVARTAIEKVIGVS